VFPRFFSMSIGLMDVIVLLRTYIKLSVCLDKNTAKSEYENFEYGVEVKKNNCKW
jgi:hypothetical protein